MKVGVDTEEQKSRSTFASAAASAVKYVPTGVTGFDKTIGGGLVAGSTILLGGFKGFGKTTLLCMVADAVASSKGRALYASSEEGVDGIVSVAHRLGLRNGDVDVLGSQREVEEVIEHARETKPFLTVFDSLQKFVSRTTGGSAGSIAQEKAVGDAIINYCRDTKRCAIIVNQMSKSGEMKGATDVGHAVDTVLVLAAPFPNDEEAPEEEGVRALLVEKNRKGPQTAKSYWRMTDEGKLDCVPSKSKLIDFPKKGKYRRRDED